MNQKLSLFAAFTLLSTACGPKFSATGPTFPSRGDHCDFQVLTAPPSNGFQEIGVIDFLGTQVADIPRLRSLIEPLVCGAGGDAALALANGVGNYIKATVIVMGAPSGAPMIAPASAGGCQYDTQCKGDRVCLRGDCVAPSSAK